MTIGTIQFSAGPLGNKNTTTTNLMLQRAFSPTAGRGAPMSARSNDRPAESTSDYYHTDGVYSLCSYDLNTMGIWGQNIATSVGYRYIWIIASDHPCDEIGQEGGWGRDANSFYAAFSNDPGVLPDPGTMYRIANCDATNGIGPVSNSSATDFVAGFNNFLFYNPDDASQNAYLYLGSMIANGLGQVGLHEVLVKSSGFSQEFTPVSISHDATQGLVSYQMVSRISSISYESFGFWDPANNTGQVGRWLSSDGGVTFARTGSVASHTIGQSSYNVFQSTAISINGNNYVLYDEDSRGFGVSNAVSASGTIRLTIPSNSTFTNGDSVVVTNVQGTTEANGTWAITKNASNNIDLNGSIFSNAFSTAALVGYVNPSSIAVAAGQYVTLVPTSSVGVVSSSPDLIRISSRYDGVFTIPFDMTSCNNYLQTCRCIVEDGVIISYAMVCFPGDVGIPSLYRNTLPENGGGTNAEFIDVYGMVLPGQAATAATAAPFGAQASCSSGTVTLNWFNLPSGRSYRTKRYNTSSEASTDTNGTSVGDVTGTSITDTPTVGSVYYYRIWSLSAGTPQQSRIVNTYVS